MAKTCIECTHCNFSPGCGGYSELTPGYDSSLDCDKGHWEIDTFDETRETFRTKLLTAKNCKDFSDFRKNENG